MVRRALPCLLLLWLAIFPSCGAPQETVVVFHAGSLSRLLEEISRRFQQDHPGVTIKTESSGSLDAVRKITELNKHCDLIAVADHRLIQRFLMPQRVRRAYRFLGNELVLARSDAQARASGSFDPWRETWHQQLTAGRFSYGISDRDRDPAGYYAELAWKLAEIHYQRPGLYRELLEKLNPRWIRPKSSELVALLQSGALDLAFLYQSAALQSHLQFISLPAQISLAEEAYTDVYSAVALEIAGGRPGQSVVIEGAPIRYGIALLSSSGPWAERLLEFVLSPAIQNLYRELGYLNVPIQSIDKELAP